jgi:DNA-binding response OmpR family regulator
MSPGKILIIHQQRSDCSALKSILSRERYDVIEASLDMAPFDIGDCCLVLLDALATVSSTRRIGPAHLRDRSPASSLGSANAAARRFARRKPMQIKRKEHSFLKAVKLGEKTVVLSARVVRGGVGEVRLTRFEYSIFHQLLSHANRTVPSVNLVRKLWPSDATKGVHSLRALIRNLRRKIEPDPAQPQYIVTDLAVGYRLRLSGTGRGR